MSLKDFKPDEPDFERHEPKESIPIEPTGYQEEITTLKIDKLSNRVTIISIILPCIIGAILIFAYLDMKERVVDVDQTKNTQVERVSQQLEEKLNALDVKIAKNRFDLDKQIPELGNRQTAVEGNLAKIVTDKANKKEVAGQLAKLEKQVSTSHKQLETMKKSMDKVVTENSALIDKTVVKIKEDIQLFKEEFDARLLELSDYELQLGELRKNFSLTDKKVRRVEEEAVSKTALSQKSDELTALVSTTADQLEKRVMMLDKKLAANISRLQKDIDLALKQSAGASGPAPQLNIDVPEPEPKPIGEELLTE
jgi:chromosome segregation ATPase